MKKCCFMLLAIISMSSLQAREYTMTQLSKEPRIYLFENFLSDKECDEFIKRAEPNLTRSTVVGEKAHQDVVHQARTSSDAWLHTGSDKFLTMIEERIEKVTKIPKNRGEGFQVLHYIDRQQYLPHHDYHSGDGESAKAFLSRGGQRVATFIMYLYDTEEGGATVFPRADISVAPVRGNAVLFYNVLPSGEVDPLTLHGGAPVLKGEKWIVTKWLRERPFH